MTKNITCPMCKKTDQFSKWMERFQLYECGECGHDLDVCDIERIAELEKQLELEKDWSKRAIRILMLMNAEISTTNPVQPAHLIHWDKKIRALIAETGNVCF